MDSVQILLQRRQPEDDRQFARQGFPDLQKHLVVAVAAKHAMEAGVELGNLIAIRVLGSGLHFRADDLHIVQHRRHAMLVSPDLLRRQLLPTRTNYQYLMPRSDARSAGKEGVRT